MEYHMFTPYSVCLPMSLLTHLASSVTLLVYVWYVHMYVCVGLICADPAATDYVYK